MPQPGFELDFGKDCGSLCFSYWVDQVKKTCGEIPTAVGSDMRKLQDLTPVPVLRKRAAEGLEKRKLPRSRRIRNCGTHLSTTQKVHDRCCHQVPAETLLGYLERVDSSS